MNSISQSIEKTIYINEVEPVLVLGFHDQFLNEIDHAYPDIKLNARGNRIKIIGHPKKIEEIESIIQELTRLALRNGRVDDRDIETLLAIHQEHEPEVHDELIASQLDSKDNFILQKASGEAVHAKTPGQQQIVKSTARHDVVFAIGPAGTGKTYTSVALAVQALKNREIKKIVLARPAVEAGENLGFLPGDLLEKIDPYLRPLYDALGDMLDRDELQLLLSKNVIEIAPLAYMRGRTLNNAFVILDEAQNATNVQMKMFLTRLGYKSRAIITGDITQTDLPHREQSGLVSIQKILKHVEGISFVYLDEKDVVRHKLVRDIIKAYDRYNKGDLNT